MKKLAILLGVLLLVSMSVFAAGQTEAAGAAKTFTPSKNIDWYVTSSPGGGSDIFTRTIMDIASEREPAQRPERCCPVQDRRCR